MTQLVRSNFQNHPFHLVSPSPWPMYTNASLLALMTAFLLFYAFLSVCPEFRLGSNNLALGLTKWIHEFLPVLLYFILY